MKLDLGLTESEEMLKKAVLDFMRRDAPRDVIKALQDTDIGCNEELWRKIAKLGWLGIIIPEQYGGTGNSLTSAGVLYEALGTGPLPGPHFSSGILGSSVILAAGTEEQKQSLLPKVAQGEIVLTLALTESEYGWEPGAIQTTAASLNGDFVINGVKLFTFDAQAATHFIVVARTGRSAAPSRRLSLFVVDSQAPGVSVHRLPGFLAGRVFEVRLDSVKVPGTALLGEKNKGWPAVKEAMLRAAPVLCAYKVGGCQTVCELALEYSRTRVQFGMPIGRFQRVQDMIIEMVTHADAARWTTYEALWKLDTQRPAAESVHTAKAVASEAYWEICTLAHRVFSGVSYSREHPASFHTRASRALYHYLGDPAYHRQQLGRLLVG
jgi:alkylation response protein AidB-like acyl-CoA dehydrogenase